MNKYFLHNGQPCLKVANAKTD